MEGRKGKKRVVNKEKEEGREEFKKEEGKEEREEWAGFTCCINHKIMEDTPFLNYLHSTIYF